ncbi:transposase family protein [Streptomyces broussonetiae]|uniref:transposase family protein n=1 Tax=Streptomyces broussonetiae TaxID=2686304 RepID=UPI001E3DEEE6|nr:transposase family protein [Streptomyces broussonetiae]
MPDPRARRGRRFPLIAIVAAAAASVLGGARSLTAVTEWIADAPRCWPRWTTPASCSGSAGLTTRAMRHRPSPPC